jgi:diguanylate cyclase (GGDEF)-like protein
VEQLKRFFAYIKRQMKLFNLEDKLFAILLVFGMVISVINVIINNAIGFRFDANYKWFIFFISTALALAYQIRGGSANRVRNVIFFEIVYLFLPNGWLLTRGNSYSTMSYLFLITVLICLVLEGKSRLFFIASELAIVIGLLYYEYVETISQTNAEDIVFRIDSLFQVPVAMITTIAILVLFSNAHRKEEQQLQEYSSLMEEKNRILTDITVTDELTGVYNRRYVFQKLEEIKNHLDLMTYQVHIAIVDIDNFKTINDAFGHVTGDQVLRKVSGIMREIVAQNGYVGRYGGDEFVIILNDISHAESKLIIECLRQEIQAITDFKDFTVTVSGGMSRFYPYDEIDDVLNRADSMLYKAKSESKNRMMLESQENI